MKARSSHADAAILASFIRTGKIFFKPKHLLQYLILMKRLHLSIFIPHACLRTHQFRYAPHTGRVIFLSHHDENNDDLSDEEKGKELLKTFFSLLSFSLPSLFRYTSGKSKTETLSLIDG
jgi:hypothetical protein